MSHQAHVATMVPYTSDVHLVNPAFSGKHKLDIPVDMMICCCFANVVPKEVVNEKLNHTTKLSKYYGQDQTKFPVGRPKSKFPLWSKTGPSFLLRPEFPTSKPSCGLWTYIPL